MRVGDITQVARGRVAVAGGEVAPATAESRALVALEPAVHVAAVPTCYRQAPFQVPFLAHLLAVKGRHAQTRERRRAEPQEALAAYRATARLVH